MKKHIHALMIFVIAATMLLLPIPVYAVRYETQHDSFSIAPIAEPFTLTYGGKKVVVAVLAGLGITFYSVAQMENAIDGLELRFDMSLIQTINHMATQLNPFTPNISYALVSQQVVDQIANHAISEWGGSVRGNQIVSGSIHDSTVGIQIETNLPVIDRNFMAGIYNTNAPNDNPLLQNAIEATASLFREMLEPTAIIAGDVYTIRTWRAAIGESYWLGVMRNDLEVRSSSVTRGNANVAANRFTHEILGFYICANTMPAQVRIMSKNTWHQNAQRNNPQGITLTSTVAIPSLALDLGNIYIPGIIARLQGVNALTNVAAAIQAMVQTGAITSADQDFHIVIPHTLGGLTGANVGTVVIPRTGVLNPPTIDLEDIERELALIAQLIAAGVLTLTEAMEALRAAGYALTADRVIQFDPVDMPPIPEFDLDFSNNFNNIFDAMPNLMEYFPFSIPFDLLQTIRVLGGQAPIETLGMTPGEFRTFMSAQAFAYGELGIAPANLFPPPRFEIEFPAPFNYTWVLDLADYQRLINIIRFSVLVTFIVALLKLTPGVIRW